MLLGGVLSNYPHNLSYQVASIFGIVVDILGHVASGISCPWLLFFWVAPYR